MDRPPSGLALDNALWRFALDFYGREGVAPACLLLQDKAGVDVNILLCTLFAAADRGIALSADDLADLDAHVAGWRREVVEALRSLRIRLKTGPSPAPCPETDALRTRIKESELQAEQIALAMLWDWLERQAKGLDHSAADLPALLRRLLRHFDAAAAENAAAPEIEAALARLSRAVQEVAAPATSFPKRQSAEE